MPSSSGSSDESVVLIVDPLPLRNIGLVSVLDRLSPTRKFNVVSLPPDEAEKWVRTDCKCSMIIYNVGGKSVSDHKHQKRIRALLRTRIAPLVVFSDNNDRKEVLSALNAGAQGFLYAGTDLHLAQQALSFIFEGGTYFPTARARRGPVASELAIENGLSAERHPAPEPPPGGTNQAAALQWANMDLTDRQKAVLEHLSRGDSNKAIARHLGIREGTVKVHVRQIMRKLGVVNRTQVAIACAGVASNDAGANEPDSKGKNALAAADGFSLSLSDPLAGAKRLLS
jgi:DNA-binding NarL/FixJ family response regulator